MTKKHSKKTLELGKHTIFGRGGVGVSQIHEKKIVSVGLFSMFRHPLVSDCCPWVPIKINTIYDFILLKL